MPHRPLVVVALIVSALVAGCFHDNGDDDAAASSWTATPANVDGRVAAVGLVDGDDVFDLLVGGDDVRLLLGRGDGTFEAVEDAGVACPGCDVRDVALGDVHEDGLPDALVLTRDGVRVYRHDGNLSFTEQDAGDHLVAATGASLGLADVDNDGDLDIAIGGDGVRVFLNDGNGTFASAYAVTASGGDAFAFVFANEDMLLDLAVAGEDGVTVLLNDDGNNGTFEPEGSPLPVSARTLVPWDHDNDQLMDLLVAGDDGIIVLRGTGRGSFEEGVRLAAGSPVHAAVGVDVDNDRWEDVLAMTPAGPRLWMSGGNGEGFSEASIPASAAGALVVADLDRDGRVDALTVGATSSRLTHDLDVGHHVAFVLEGNESNDAGVGVKTTISTGTFLMQRQSGGVASPHIAVPVHPHFGLADDVPETLNVGILWPSGILQFERPPAARLLDQATAAREAMNEAPWEGC